MYTEEDQKIFKNTVREGASILLSTNKKDLEEKLFPIWRKGIHEILKNHGCQCGESKSCFLNHNKEKQIEFGKKNAHLCFENYLDIIMQGRSLFIKTQN